MPGWVTVQGQVLRSGVVVSTATLQVVVRQRCPSGGTSQAGANAGGTGSDLSGGCEENSASPPVLN
jgi:hypothetical protein